MQDFTTDTARASRVQVADLAGRSDRAGLLQLAGHVALLAVTASLIALTRDGWLVWPAMLVHGIVQVALFAPLHETVHRTAFRSRWLNDLVASVVGLIHVLPARYFRRFHFAHHRHTQDPDRDPELASAKPTRLWHYWLYISGTFYWRDRFRELIRHAGGRSVAKFIPDNERAVVIREARWHLAVYAGLAALVLGWQVTEPLLFWFGPAVLGQPFLRAYLLAEHTGCPECPDMFKNTRTTRSNALVRFLMWNMPYHTEHHAFPAVPFHRLAELHGRIRERLVHVEPAYAGFHRTYHAALAAGDGERFTRSQPAQA